MRVNKVVSILAGVVLLAGAATAQAFWTGDFITPYDTISGTQGYDWLASGSGTADIATNELAPGKTFDFRYQANLVGFMLPNGNPIPGVNYPGLNTKYEITIVAKLPEIVTAVIPLGAPYPVIATFKSLTGGSFAMYYDDLLDSSNVQSNVAAGTGFNDGQLIASGNFFSGEYSSFLATAAGNGSGSFVENAKLTSVDDAFFDPDLMLGSIFKYGFRIEGTLNQPPLESSTVRFFDGNDGFAIYNPATDDQLFKVDASSRFTQVPEPSTLLLLGAGLLGLAGFSRRNRAN